MQISVRRRRLSPHSQEKDKIFGVEVRHAGDSGRKFLQKHTSAIENRKHSARFKSFTSQCAVAIIFASRACVPNVSVNLQRIHSPVDSLTCDNGTCAAVIPYVRRRTRFSSLSPDNSQLQPETKCKQPTETDRQTMNTFFLE